MEKHFDEMIKLVAEYIQENYPVIKTNNKTYKVRKSKLKPSVREYDWGNNSVSELFSPRGVELSLRVDIKIPIYISDDMNVSTEKIFHFYFKSIFCKYNHTEERFELSEFKLNNITETDRYPW